METRDSVYPSFCTRLIVVTKGIKTHPFPNPFLLPKFLFRFNVILYPRRAAMLPHIILVSNNAVIEGEFISHTLPILLRARRCSNFALIDCNSQHCYSTELNSFLNVLLLISRNKIGEIGKQYSGSYLAVVTVSLGNLFCRV